MCMRRVRVDARRNERLMRRLCLILLYSLLGAACDPGAAFEKFSTVKSEEFVQQLPGRDPSRNVSSIEVWRFTDVSVNYFTSRRNLAKVARLLRTEHGTQAQALATSIWRELLTRTGESVMKDADRVLSHTVLVFYDDGEIATITINLLATKSLEPSEAEARVGETLIPARLKIMDVLMPANGTAGESTQASQSKETTETGNVKSQPTNP